MFCIFTRKHFLCNILLQKHFHKVKKGRHLKVKRMEVASLFVTFYTHVIIYDHVNTIYYADTNLIISKTSSRISKWNSIITFLISSALQPMTHIESAEVTQSNRRWHLNMCLTRLTQHVTQYCKTTRIWERARSHILVFLR